MGSGLAVSGGSVMGAWLKIGSGGLSHESQMCFRCFRNGKVSVNTYLRDESAVGDWHDLDGWQIDILNDLVPQHSLGFGIGSGALGASRSCA